MKFRALLVWATLLCGFFAIVLFIRAQSGKFDHLVIRFPNGFRGKVTVIEDPAHGLELVGRHGVATIDVPDDGKVALKSMDFYENWIHYDFFYRNGQRIEDFEPERKPRGIQVFDLGRNGVTVERVNGKTVKSGGQVYYLVGTYDEYQRIESNGATELTK